MTSKNIFSKIGKYLLNLGLVVIISFVSLASSSFFAIAPALAHRPHDVVQQVRLSPNYQNNQTIFLLVRYNLFKSTDNGKSWQRIVKGINGIGELNDLSGNLKDDQIMYLTSKYNEIYKTENGGENWFKVNNGLTNVYLRHVYVDPNSADFVVVSDSENRLYKTENGGENWQEILTAKNEITSILITEKEGAIIIGDRNGDIFISKDKGENWQELNSLESQNTGGITAITKSDKTGDTQSFLVGTAQKGIYKTTDGGKSFTPMNQGLSDPKITDMLVDQDGNLYVSTWDEGFFFSGDGGQTWMKKIQGLTKDAQANEMKAPHFSVLAQSKNNVFLGGFDGLFASDDTGSTWQPLETLSLGIVMSFDLSPNYMNDQTLAIVTYVGNFYLSQDGGKTWTPKNKGLEIPRLTSQFDLEGQHPRRFFDVGFSPNYANDNTIFSSLLWSKLAKSNNSADNWQVVTFNQPIRGLQIVISPNFAEDRTVYIGNQRGIIYKSTNGGESFSEISKIEKVAGNDPPSLVISPNYKEDQTLFSATQKGIYISTDGGKKWTSVSQLSDNGKVSLQIAISPNFANDQTLLVSTHKGLFKTEDKGNTWVNLAIADLGDNAPFEGVAISPNYQNDQTIIASARGKGLYKSNDGGNSFQAIGDPNLPYGRVWQIPASGLALRFSPNYAQDNTLYSIGSATTAVYKSTDGGNTWETMTVPINPVSEIENYDLPTSISLWLYIYRSKVLRFLGAALMGLLAYFAIGFLNLEKRIPLSKYVFKIIAAVVLFTLAFFVLNHV